MIRFILQTCVWLLLLVGAQTHAWAKADLTPKIAPWDFLAAAEAEPAASWRCNQVAIRVAAFLSYDFAPDVHNGPNLYAYVKQNPWSKFDPDGLKTIRDYEADIGKARTRMRHLETKRKSKNGLTAYEERELWVTLPGAISAYESYIASIRKTAVEMSDFIASSGMGPICAHDLDDEDQGYKDFNFNLKIRSLPSSGIAEKYVKGDSAGAALEFGRDVVLTLVGGKVIKFVGGKIVGESAANNVAVRQAYLKQLEAIPGKIDTTLPLREQAIQAFNLRNAAKIDARAAMTDRNAAALLDKTDPIPTIQDVVRRAYKDKGLVGDDMWRSILESSTRSRSSVNQALGVGN